MEDEKQKTYNKRDSHDRRGGRGRGRGRRKEREPKEFDQKILDLARVTRVTAGGKRMSFRATLVIGDRKGRVGMGTAKGADVALAVEKAFRQARKRVINVPVVNGTFPHAVQSKFGAAVVLLKPAPKGTGLKSGGAIRVILELGGVPNAVSKNLGSDNKINIAKATMGAMKEMNIPEGVQTDSAKKKAKKENQAEKAVKPGAEKKDKPKKKEGESK